MQNLSSTTLRLGAFVLPVLLLLSGCHRQPEHAAGLPNQAPVKARTQPIGSKSHLAVEEVVGTVRAKLRASIQAKVSGRIERMLATPGLAVKAGDVLAQLGVQEIQAKLDQASAQREQAVGDLKRFSALLQQQAVTRAEFDAVQARQRIAEAALNEAQTMLGYAQVLAPFDGVITRKLADVGDLAAPGRALLEVEDPSALRLEADLPEALLSRVQLGARMPLRFDSVTNVLEGVVSEIAPVADPNSRTFLVKFDLPAAAGVRAGQFGRVGIPIGETTALRMPVAGVVIRGQMELAFVVTNRIAQLRLIKTGKQWGTELEVVSGLEPGEQVVIEGAAQLRDGQPVEVSP